MDIYSIFILMGLLAFSGLLVYLLRNKTLRVKLIIWGLLLVFPYSILLGGVIADMYITRTVEEPYGLSIFGILLNCIFAIIAVGIILIIISIILFIKNSITIKK